MTLPPAHSIRHRLTRLRSQLREEQRNFRVGSSVAKIVRGKLLALDESIDICDQELLAEEQGRASMSEALDGEYVLASEAQAEIDRIKNIAFAAAGEQCEKLERERKALNNLIEEARDGWRNSQAEIERLRGSVGDCVGYFEDLIRCARHFASRNTSAPFQAHQLCDAIAEAEDILAGLNASLTPPPAGKE